MANKNVSKYYTLDKIPIYRQQFINTTLKHLSREYNIRKWPIECVELIKQIENEKHIKLKITSTTVLKENEDAKTIYVPIINIFLIYVNRKKIHVRMIR